MPCVTVTFFSRKEKQGKEEKIKLLKILKSNEASSVLFGNALELSRHETLEDGTKTTSFEHQSIGKQTKRIKLKIFSNF